MEKITGQQFEIRKTRMEDLDRVMEMYAHARTFMAEHGNPNQWGPTNWPPRELIVNDIESGRSYVCILKNSGEIVGTFYFHFAENAEPNYRDIACGTWSKDTCYGVVHRITSDGARGVGSYCLNWALDQSNYLRIDTHPDNTVMQSLLTKLGFKRCGIIHVDEDSYPRYAYDASR